MNNISRALVVFGFSLIMTGCAIGIEQNVAEPYSTGPTELPNIQGPTTPPPAN